MAAASRGAGDVSISANFRCCAALAELRFSQSR
ncbi:hypothetical protein R3I94_006979 [Phoxinus phoxinus]